MRLSILAGVLVFFATTFLAASTRQAEAAYSPTYSAKYCNGLDGSFPTSSTPDLDLGGNPACTGPASVPANTSIDVTESFALPSGDYMFGSPLFRYVDPGTTVTSDAGIINGSKVGGASIQFTIGILNAPCTSPLPQETVLYESSTSAGPITPDPEGTADRFASLATDANSDGIADASSPFVHNNLSIYEDFLDPDLDYPGGPNGPQPPITPIARYSGATTLLAGGELTLMTVFHFAANVLMPFASDADNYKHPLGRSGTVNTTDEVSVIVFNDPTAAIDSPTPITDVCSPFTFDLMLLGKEPGGTPRMTTGTAGTVMLSEWSYGQRDKDSDNLENQVDTCPSLVDSGSDSDGDGIDDVCDPAPGTAASDHDGDGVFNRGDNCPLVANGGLGQINSEMLTAYATTAFDGGPRTDGIGDACDANPTLSNPPPYSYKEKHNFQPFCIGQTDADGDGYCASTDLDDADNGVGGYTRNSGVDSDDDGWGASLEFYIGTDPVFGCGYTAGGDPASETWPADLFESDNINTTDVLQLKPVFLQAVPPASTRFDLFPSGNINTTDVLQLKPVFLKSCTLP